MSTQRSAAKPRNDASAYGPASNFSVAAQQIAAVLQTGIRWGVGLGISYYAYLSIVALSGQSTTANIVLNFLGNLTTSSTLGWTAGAGGVLYGLRQRKLRGDVTERLHGRIEELEQESDPKRTSSQLTKRGKTNPKDK